MKKDNIFPIVVFAFSVLTIADLLFRPMNFLALINAILGIIGVILFFRKHEKYRPVLYAWIYLQFIIIMKKNPEQEIPIVDLSQFINLPFFLGLSFNEVTYSVGLNFMPFIYLIAFKRLQTKSLIGQELNIKLYRDNNILTNSLPQTVNVLNIVDFPENKNWILAELTNAIDFEEMQYRYSLIKSKEGIPIVKNVKQQMAYLRLVENKELLENGISNLDEYPFIDWIFVE